MIWDPAFQLVKSQCDNIFHWERNTHNYSQHADKAEIFELPEKTEHIKDIETGQDEYPSTMSQSHMHRPWTAHKKTTRNEKWQDEYTSIRLNNTFNTINFWEARQLANKPTGSNWVNKMKHNTDGPIWFIAR